MCFQDSIPKVVDSYAKLPSIPTSYIPQSKVAVNAITGVLKEIVAFPSRRWICRHTMLLIYLHLLISSVYVMDLIEIVHKNASYSRSNCTCLFWICPENGMGLSTVWNLKQFWRRATQLQKSRWWSPRRLIVTLRWAFYGSDHGQVRYWDTTIRILFMRARPKRGTKLKGMDRAWRKLGRHFLKVGECFSIEHPEKLGNNRTVSVLPMPCWDMCYKNDLRYLSGKIIIDSKLLDSRT